MKTNPVPLYLKTIEQNKEGISEKKAGLILQDMVKAQEWSEKRSRIAVSGQAKCDTGELDKRGVREQGNYNTAVG